MNTEPTGGSFPTWPPEEEFDYEAYKAKEDAKRIQRRLKERRHKQPKKTENESRPYL